jgi:hypothetical protein
MLQRGFWLYVWRVRTPKGEMLYVGRTSDSSSPHATAPYTRMGQHLGFAKASNSLRRLLLENGVEPEACEEFDLVSFGPIFPEVSAEAGTDRDERMKHHKPIRDTLAGLEKKLRDALDASGYQVLNIVHSKKPVDAGLWADVRAAFAGHFPKLAELDEGVA